jgi:signal transduction histidine kinase
MKAPMRSFLHSLRGRLALSHLAVILVAMLATGFALLSLIAGYFYNAAQQDLLAQANLITTTLSPELTPPSSLSDPSPSFNAMQQQIGNLSVQVESQSKGESEAPTDELQASNLAHLADLSIAIHAGLETHVRIVDARGVVLIDSDEPSGGGRLAAHPGVQTALAGELWHARETAAGRPWMTVAAPLRREGEILGAILLRQPLEGLQAVLGDIRLRLILATALALPLSATVGWGLAHSLVRPLRELTLAAERLSRGDFEYPLPRAGMDEIGQLSRTFESMRARLAATERLRTQFVSDVSHELRTPLTAIKGLVETLEDGAVDDPQVRDRFLHSIETETERLIRLANDLLELTRADAKAIKLDLQRLDLVSTCRDLVDTWQPITASKNIKLHLTSDVPSLEARADPDRIEQILIIALDNALKHTEAGGEIQLEVEALHREGRALWARLRVKDTGPGIPAADIPHLFERFYRVDPSRDRKRGGSGLGLSIAKALVEAHEGRISIHSPPETPLPGDDLGAELVVDLPRA